MLRPSSVTPARACRDRPRRRRCLVPCAQTRRAPWGVQERALVARRAQQLVHRAPASLSAGHRLPAALASAQAALSSSRAKTRRVALGARDIGRSRETHRCAFRRASSLPKKVSCTCSPLGLETLVRPPQLVLRPSSAPPAQAGHGPPRKGRSLVTSAQTRRTPWGDARLAAGPCDEAVFCPSCPGGPRTTS